MIKIKNQGYISWHVTEINDLYFTSFHVIFHVILCDILRHFMLYFTHFIVHIAYIARISRTSFHVAFHTHRAFHTLHRISHHFLYYFKSFHHKNAFHSHSCHLTLKRREIGSKLQALQ